jgi:hypothetical protein
VRWLLAIAILSLIVAVTAIMVPTATAAAES